MEKQNIIEKHPMITSLEEIAEHKELSIHAANFETGEITVKVKNTDSSSFHGMMKSVKFIDIIDRMSILFVNFESGEITVRWHDQDVLKVAGKYNITKDVIESVKNGRKVQAIKFHRENTGLGLVQAKEQVEALIEEMRKRGALDFTGKTLTF